MSVAQRPPVGEAISYEDLYRRWEGGNWSAMEIEFSADREGWAALSDVQRSSAAWIYSMFFYGEDSVADNLSPYIDAAPTEEQKYFLATQQVDEARHAVFFHRFFREVIGAGDDVGSTLAFTDQHLGWGYRKVFGRLDEMAAELRADRSLPKFAQAITLYHLVVEATLAQPGQHFIEDYFVKAGTMPGFSEGMANISRDEQRHIGFGVKVLSELFRQSEECKQAATELLGEVLPWALAVFVPPGWDLEYTRCYGFELEDIYAFALRSVEAKWRAAGYPVEEFPPGVFPLDLSKSPEERAENALRLLRSGVLGEPGQPLDSSRETLATFFNMVARAADTEATGDGSLTAEWRFRDAEPWHVAIDNGSTTARPGRATDPDVVLRTSWRDWVELATGELRPARAMMTGRLVITGSPLNMLRFRRTFPDSTARR